MTYHKLEALILHNDAQKYRKRLRGLYLLLLDKSNGSLANDQAELSAQFNGLNLGECNVKALCMLNMQSFFSGMSFVTAQI